MSGFPQEHHRERGHGRYDRGGRYDEQDDYDNYGQPGRGQLAQEYDDDPRSQSYSQGGPGRGYAPPPGVPPSGRGNNAFSSQGGLDRGDFASDADIDRMVAAGEFNNRSAQRQRDEAYGYDGRAGAGGERRGEYGRYDTPTGPPSGGRGDEYRRYDASSGPPPGGRGEYGRYDTPTEPPPGGRADEYGRYDAPSGPPGRERPSDYDRYDTPSGPPPGRGHQSQQSHQGYGSRGAGYGETPDRPNQYGSKQAQGRSQYDSPQAPRSDYGQSQGNAPSGGFGASREGEGQYRSGYGGPPNNRNEPSRRGEADSYYNQQGSSGQGDRYAHLAGIAQQHGDDDPEVYRRATQGLHDRIQYQAQSRRPDDDDGYKAQVDAHRKAYGDDDHGPMDANAIGAAAAMEAFKQTAAGSSNAPAGAFSTGQAGGGSTSKPGRVAGGAERVEEEEGAETAARGSGGLQDKLMGLAMSHAGKLFDKKNGGSSGGDKSQDKAQAMQSAAATAMQLFAQYQSKGKLESGDMSKVMGLVSNLL